MEISDYEQVLELWLQCEGLGLRSLDDSREGIDLFLKRNPTTNFIAVADEKVIGVIMTGHDGRRGYIYHTVVKKEYRNQGIGSQLVEKAIEALRKEGITRVCLNVMETNVHGKEFWCHKGWEKKDFLGFYSRSITDKENKPLFEIE